MIAKRKYPADVPFHPAERYPEYRGEHTDGRNRLYGEVRETPAMLVLDRENFGTPKWNPFREIVRPWITVFVKTGYSPDTPRSSGRIGEGMPRRLPAFGRCRGVSRRHSGDTLKGKTCVITGATSGIGRAAAIQLGKLQADLILIGRNERRGIELMRKLGRARADGNALFLRADLSDQREVRDLADAIKDRFASIDVLINNAGARYRTFRSSPDNIELTFATNHLSHFLLTILLLERLRAAKAARVVTVSSATHSGASGDFGRNLSAENYDQNAAYGSSKLANLMFAYELARRLCGTQITSNAVDPGVVATNFGRNDGYIHWLWHIGYYGLKRNLVFPRKGAETTIFLATSPEVEGFSGKYFFRNRVAESSRISHDVDAAKTLWNWSLRLTGLNEQIGPTWALIKP